MPAKGYCVGTDQKKRR